MLKNMSEDEHKVEYTTVSIPKPLIEKIKERMKGTGFGSVSSYVTYVLRQIISSIEGEERSKLAFTKEEEEKVKQRLRDLGYID
jgi:Arc/MetJ-type ribon-helix-helix transcriptional regulator